jgi:hypothetical protein
MADSGAPSWRVALTLGDVAHGLSVSNADFGLEPWRVIGTLPHNVTGRRPAGLPIAFRVPVVAVPASMAPEKP